MPPQSPPEGILPPPNGPEHCWSIPPLYCNGDSLEEVLLAAFLPCCLAQALPNVPHEAECCRTEHTGRFHGKRGKVMADLQGGVLGTLQMLSFRCHGPRLSGGRRNMRRCVGIRACGVPHKHLPRLPRQN